MAKDIQQTAIWQIPTILLIWSKTTYKINFKKILATNSAENCIEKQKIEKSTRTQISLARLTLMHGLEKWRRIR